MASISLAKLTERVPATGPDRVKDPQQCSSREVVCLLFCLRFLIIFDFRHSIYAASGCRGKYGHAGQQYRGKRPGAARKHAGAIHIKNDISCLQRKAWNVLLHNAYDDFPDVNLQLHTIPCSATLWISLGLTVKRQIPQGRPWRTWSPPRSNGTSSITRASSRLG